MHQNLAVILQQFNYGKSSFIVLIPDWLAFEWPFIERVVMNILLFSEWAIPILFFLYFHPFNTVYNTVDSK